VKKKSWRNATYDELCRMDRDNVSYGDFWIVTDTNEITIAKQKMGESCQASVSIPRRVFNRFVDQYLKEREVARA
jgi:hypothetical protein